MKEKTEILFICVENARRSQMAEEFANTFGQGKLEVYSARAHALLLRSIPWSLRS